MRSLILSLLTALCSLPASAAPLVSGPVSVNADGEVHLHGRKVGTVPRTGKETALSHALVTVAGHRLLHVALRGPDERSPQLVQELSGAKTTVYRGITGPQGVDGEWSTALRVDQQGVLLYQQRDGVDRCDGRPSLLFPRLYDFATRRFRPVAPRVQHDAMPQLVARRAPPASTVPPLNQFRFVGASTVAGDGGSAENLAPPARLDDGDPSTAWTENVGGDGQGQFLTARRSASPYRLAGLALIPGDASSRQAFARHNRVRSMVLQLSPTRRYRILLPRDPLRAAAPVTTAYWVKLPTPVAATCATLVLQSVYPGRGKAGGTTAISELRLYTELDLDPAPQVRLARDLAHPDEERARAAAGVLARMGSRALPVLQRALTAPKTRAVVRPRAIAVLARLKLPQGAQMLAQLLPEASAPQRQQIIEALVALGPAALPQLLKASRSGSPRVCAAALRALGRLGGPAARDALLERAGQGSQAQRQAVTSGLALLHGSDHLDAVLAAVERVTAAPARADLIRVAGKLGRAMKRRHSRTAARLAALWSQEDFEVRYRILTAVGRLDPKGQLPLLLRATRLGDPILRWRAAQMLRDVRSPAAQQALLRLLADPDPRLRRTAALALGQRPLSRKLGQALARRLRRERWPMAASAVAEALGRQCTPDGLKALRDRMVRGPRGVDLRALISLASCRPTGLHKELLTMVERAAWRAPMRQRALQLLGPQGAKQHARKLCRLMVELRRRAIRSQDEEALAVAMARALGQAATPAAVEALADALALDPNESIRVAAAAALGRVCDKRARQTVRRATSDASPLVQRAARRTLARCRW